MMIKKMILLVVSIIVLSTPIKVEASILIPPTITSKQENKQFRTNPCTGHDWVYVTHTDGKVIYYNYECNKCFAYKYSSWIKK